MIINTLVAMCAGFVLNLMLGAPKGFLSAEKLILGFSKSLERLLKKSYDTTPEARRMAGGVLVFLTLLIFAVVPLALMIAGYLFLPVVGLILDCIFCWMAFSIRDSRMALNQVFRGEKAGNALRMRKGIALMTDEDCTALENDDLIRKAVECAADKSADKGVGSLFFIALGGGFGGMFYFCTSVLNSAMREDDKKYKNFGKPARALWNILNFIPARICAVAMLVDAAFLKLDAKNSSAVYSCDRKKISRKNLGVCRSIMAGALKIRLTEQEYTDKNGVKIGTIGNPLRPCEAQNVYWANQLMYGSVFACFVFFAVVRIVLAIVV